VVKMGLHCQNKTTYHSYN